MFTLIVFDSISDLFPLVMVDNMDDIEHHQPLGMFQTAAHGVIEIVRIGRVGGMVDRLYRAYRMTVAVDDAAGAFKTVLDRFVVVRSVDTLKICAYNKIIQIRCKTGFLIFLLKFRFLPGKL